MVVIREPTEQIIPLPPHQVIPLERLQQLQTQLVERLRMGLVVEPIVDPDGKIKFMEVSCEGVGRDASSLVRKVKAAQYVREHPDEVCPAKWEEGQATLAPSLDLVGKI